MKFGKSVLLEIAALVLEGLVKGEDVSEKLRQIDVDVVGPEDGDENSIELSEEYVASHPRGEEPPESSEMN